MNFYVAPLEGITGYIFRNIFNECFGTGVNKYYTPFLALCSKKGVTDKEKNEISPENNKNYKLVPQVMTVCVEDFVKAKEKLRSLVYDEININFERNILKEKSDNYSPLVRMGGGMIHGNKKMFRVCQQSINGQYGVNISFNLVNKLDNN